MIRPIADNTVHSGCWRTHL